MARAAANFGIVGGLSAFPRRLAARALAAKGGQLRRGITRRTSQVVLGRTLLEKSTEAEIEQRVAALRDSGATLLSENGFLRWLGLLERSAPAELARRSLLEQSGLEGAAFDYLALFDAFENDAEPYSFRDLILSRKYAGLLKGGATWSAVARAVHRAGPVASLTAAALHPDGPHRVHAMEDGRPAELDGQRLLPLAPDEGDAEECFTLAEAAESAGLLAEAAVLYGQCAARDPGDSVAAFNRGNCLRAQHDLAEAAHAYALAIKADPNFVEAWFNLADLLRVDGRIDSARQHLLRAIAIDPDYADAIYNLATLEYDADELVAARRWWARYLELDQTSEWARLATRGIAFIDLSLRKSAG